MKRELSRWQAGLLCFVAVLSVGWGGDGAPAREEAARSGPAVSAFSETPHSPHAFRRVSNKIYCGAEPDAASLAFLVSLGIRTIVSVDGARPDVEAARKAGLRYVHLPIGYDGVPRATQAALSSLVAEATPVFIHCHHGKHRGPAAAAIAAMLEGGLDQNQAVEFLALAGTSEDYAGLWRDVREFHGVPQDVEAAPLVATAEVDSMTEAMSGIDRIYDRLKTLAEANWQPDPDHPDVVAVHEAKLLVEGFRETKRHAEDAELVTRFAKSERLASDFHAQLKVGQLSDASGSWSAIRNDCRNCHGEFRN